MSNKTYTRVQKTVEAECWNGNNLAIITRFTMGKEAVDVLLETAKSWEDYSQKVFRVGFPVETTDGLRLAGKGDWVIKNESDNLEVMSKNEFYHNYKPLNARPYHIITYQTMQNNESVICNKLFHGTPQQWLNATMKNSHQNIFISALLLDDADMVMLRKTANNLNDNDDSTDSEKFIHKIYTGCSH